MIIRPATLADAESIAAVHIASWQQAYKDLLPQDRLGQLPLDRYISRWNQRLQESTQINFVAELETEIVGFSSVGPSRDDDAQAHTAELYAIYLLSSTWGKGIGKALCEKSLKRLKEDGYQNVTLWVFEDNENARKFYEHMGFVFDGKTSTFEIFDIVKSEARYERTL